MFGYLFCMLLQILLGCAMIRKPYFFWHISHFLTTKDGEPTNLYLAAVRIGGVILLITAVYAISVILFY